MQPQAAQGHLQPKQYPAEQIAHCCSFRRSVGKPSVEAQSVGAAPPLQMAQLLKCTAFVFRKRRESFFSPQFTELRFFPFFFLNVKSAL